MEVINNDTTTRDNISLDSLDMTKGKSVSASMMLKTGMELAQDYTVFNYKPPRPQKDLKSQDRTIVTDPGMKPVPKIILSVNIKEKVGK